MSHAIPRIELLKEFLEEAVQLERAYEGESMWQIYSILPEEGLEELKDFVFEMKIRSGSHYYILQDVARDAGLELEGPETGNYRYRETLLREGTTLPQALEKLRRHEIVSREFYSRLAGSLRASNLDGVDSDAAAEKLELLSQEEAEHARRYGEAIEKIRQMKDRSFRF